MEALDPLDPALVAFAQEAIADNEDNETILAALRARGVNVIDSIRLLKKVRGLSLQEAKKEVHFSRAWSDMRESFDQFHEELFDAAKGVEGLGDD